MIKDITLTINGEAVRASVEPRTTLADFLRNARGLTGTHLGCEHGVCGACTILINGAPGRSCITYAATLDGGEVRTIEGFEDDALMASVREAFHAEHGLQCGFCTTGMLVTSRDIAARFPDLDEAGIRRELSGNLCRCTGYMGIVKSIQRVMREVPAESRVAKKPFVLPDAAKPGPFVPFTPVKEAPVRAHARVAAPRPVDEAPLEKGWTRLNDSFVVERSAEETWALFSDLKRMASCMPGAQLDEIDGNDLKGQMRIAFGPIKVGFKGEATVERDDAAMTGVLNGGGNDEAGGSRAKGRVTYRLIGAPDGASTTVALTLEFQLQGALAQFGRSGLVTDFAGRLIATFAKNLSDELEGRERSGDAGASLGVTSLVWSVVKGRVQGLFARLRRGKDE